MPLPIGRSSRSSAASRSTLADFRDVRDCRQGARPFAHRRAPQAIADLRGAHVQFGQRAAQRVAVHAKLFGRLALVALVAGQNFKNVAPLELPDRLRVRDSSTVHLRDQAVQFALQICVLTCQPR